MIRTTVKNLSITDMYLPTKAPALSYETSMLKKIIVLLEKMINLSSIL